MSEKDILKNVYFKRNLAKSGKENLLEKERGLLFAKWIGKGKKILDLGCRNCSLTKWFSEGNIVSGLDIDSDSIAECSKEISVMQFDLNDDWHLDKKEMFDVVVSSEVIEHLYYPEKIIEKIYFVLKTGGVFIGSVPNAFHLKNRFRLLLGKKQDTPLAEPTHINHFSAQEIKDMLKKKFKEVSICSMGKHKIWFLTDKFPGLFSFLIVFKAKK